jgi:uncharacterized paraquat-inducible protein A
MSSVAFDRSEDGDDYVPIVSRETDVRLTDVQGVRPGEVKYRFKRCPQQGIIPALLFISLCLNIAAMRLNFMTISIYKQPTETLKIFSLIKLMWEDGIHWATAALVAFSICFPFFKLGSLTLLFFVPKHNWWSRRCLRNLSWLGRFSLLDIFVELVVLTMAHD